MLIVIAIMILSACKWLVPFVVSVLNKISCCSTESERPHRCCNLYIGIFPILYRCHSYSVDCRLFSTMSWEMPLKLPLALGGFGPPPDVWFPGPTRVHIPNGILIGSAVLMQLMVATNRQ